MLCAARSSLIRAAAIAAVSVAAVAALLYRTEVHVVVVTVDDLQRGAGGPAARRLWKRLAEEGLVVERVESQAAAGVPTLRELLTGDGASPAATSLATRLAAAGYRCGAFISTAALRKPGGGLHQGFRHWDQELAGETRPARDTVSAAIGWLLGEAHEKAPNCVWLQLGSVEATTHIERLVDALDRHGYWQRTLLVVVGASAPTTAFVRPPEGRMGGERITEPVRAVDLLPTILAVIGLPATELPGRSVLMR